MTFPNKGLVILNGKNGVGKTTLLNMIANLDQNYSGEISINNVPNSTQKATHELVDYMLKNGNLIEEITVAENLAIFCQINSNLVNQFGLNHLLNSKVEYLSNGEKARLSLIVAISSDAPIILCDEPTDALDEENKAIFVDELKKLAEQKLVIVASHDKIFQVEEFSIIEVQEIININYHDFHVPPKLPNNRKRKLKLMHSLKMWYKTKFFVPKLFIAISIMALFLFFGNFILAIFGLDANVENAYAENVVQISALSNTQNQPLGEDAITAIENTENIESIYYYDFLESSDWSYNSSVVVDGNIAEPSNYKSEFSPEEMQNNEYFSGIKTVQVNIDPETGYTVIDNKNIDNNGFVNNTTAYHPTISLIPPSELLEASASSDFFDNLIVSGSMPSNENEILITNEFMQLAFNTNDPSQVIGKEYVTHCFDGYQKGANGYEWEYSTCNHYLITGVYEVTPTSGAKLYIPYSNYFANHYKDDYSNAATAYVTTSKAPELLVNELNNAIPSGVNITIPAERSAADKIALAKDQQSAFSTYLIVMLIFALMMLILLITNNVVNYKNESKRYLVLKAQHFARKQITKDILTNEFASLILLTIIATFISVFINAQGASLIFMLSILILVAIINIIYKLWKTSKDVYGTKKTK